MRGRIAKDNALAKMRRLFNSAVLVGVTDQNLTLAYMVGATDDTLRFHAVDQVGRAVIADLQLPLQK